jgi:aminoglycoside phosphotransferase (APT) family kinase protein
MSQSHPLPTTASPATPSAEVTVDVTLVRSLLRAQHPDIAEHSLESFGSGWDNAMFRLGEDLCVRLPRRQVAVELLANEQRWLPLLAQRLPLPIPAPIRIGKPSDDFPWSWSVTRWLPGVTADQADLRPDQGEVLGRFLKLLHVPAPENAPHNPYRGVALAERRASVEERLTRLRQSTASITPAIRTLWERALAADVDVASTWLHGDLHARNVLVHDGRLSAIIDWGDVCQGDRATDLAAIWMLLPKVTARTDAMNVYDASTATWQRARGWAILFGAVLLDTGLIDHPRHAIMGERTLNNVSEGP